MILLDEWWSDVIVTTVTSAVKATQNGARKS